MKLYHGSTEIVEHPETDKGRNNLDFGKGFYMTDIEQQAIDWAKRPINQICILNQEIIDRHLKFITAKRLN